MTRSGYRWLDLLHAAFISATLSALFPMAFNGPSDFRNFVEHRSSLLHVAYLAVYLAYLPFILRLLRTELRQNLQLISVLVVLFSCMSVIWSTDPLRSAVLALFIVLQYLVAIVIAWTTHPDRLLYVVSRTCAFLAVLSIFLIVLVPGYGRMTFVYPGAWQGVFTHKNLLGQFAAVYFVAQLVLVSRTRSLWEIVGLLVSLVLLVGSGSLTAIFASLAVTGMFFALRLRSYAARALLFVAGAALTVAVLAGYYDVSGLLSALDRSSTLSGRTTLWSLSIQTIADAPLLGAGLAGFWSSEAGSNFRQLAGWFIPHVHNGFLEVGLQLGVLGMALIGFQVVAALVASNRARRTTTFSGLEFCALTVILAVVIGVAEAIYLEPHSFFQTVIFVSLAYAQRVKFAQTRGSRSRSPNIPSSLQGNLSLGWRSADTGLSQG